MESGSKAAVRKTPPGGRRGGPRLNVVAPLQIIVGELATWHEEANDAIDWGDAVFNDYTGTYVVISLDSKFLGSTWFGLMETRYYRFYLKRNPVQRMFYEPSPDVTISSRRVKVPDIATFEEFESKYAVERIKYTEWSWLRAEQWHQQGYVKWNWLEGKWDFVPGTKRKSIPIHNNPRPDQDDVT